MAATAFPWYEAVKGDDLEQGDILQSCPVFVPPADLTEESLTSANFGWETQDVVIISQSCDMMMGREKLHDVLLCPVGRRSELTSGHLASDKGMEDARRGNLPAYHVLAASTLANLEREVSIVHFGSACSLPLAFVRRLAVARGHRLRWLPPYREHLSQAFARFFMRVGLPIDIPPFRKPS